MSGLRIYLFGPPRLELNHSHLPMGRNKALALVAFLVRQSDAVSRDTLLDLLWPTFSPSDARNNLRRELSILKDLLPSGTLIADRHTISIDSTLLSNGRIWVDTHEFDAHVSSSRSHPHPINEYCEKCIDAYTLAAELYASDFLSGFSLADSATFDEWQFHQSESLRNSFSHILRTLVEWYEGRGPVDRALLYAQRWVSLDPLYEEANRAVMRLFSDEGRHAAAVRQYEKLSQLLLDELGVEPEGETIELYESIRVNRGKSSKANRHLLPVYQPQNLSINLPADTTPFIGRRKELAQLISLLHSDTDRLITVTGVGGMGRTRLALAAARQIADSIDGDRFRDGVFFVPLAPVTEPALIPQTIAMAVGFAPGSERRAAEQLVAFLQPLSALLVIDNLEHLINSDIIAQLEDILYTAAGIKILATSRARIGIRGEHVFTLGGMPIMDDDGAQQDTNDPPAIDRESDAVELFTETARRISRSFSLTRDNIGPITRICQLVDGMPLGIELAAAWIELLTPDAIADEIQRSLDFLTSIDSSTPDRQSSLKAVFDSSWRLLATEERNALSCLSIFPGSFERVAAERIAGASLSVLLSLRNKSWLQPVGVNRYQIHPLLRQFLAQELAYTEAAEGRLRDRHAQFFVEMLEALNDRMRGPSSNEAFEQINAELDNLLVAMLWLVGNDLLDIVADRMSVPLLRYLESRYRYFLFQPIILEAARRAEAAGNARILGIILSFRGAFFFNGYPTRIMDYIWVDREWQTLMRLAWENFPPDPHRVSYWDIVVSWHYGRFVQSEPSEKRLRMIINLLQGENRQWEEAFARQNLGRLLTRQGSKSLEEARQSLRQSLSIFESLGDEREAAITLSFLGFNEQSRGDLEEAERMLLAAQTRLRAVGEDITAVNLNWQLADMYMVEARFDQALANFHELADALIAAGLSQLAISTLSRESYESVRYGELDNALRLRRKAMSLSIQTGDRFTEAWDCWELAEIYRVMGQPDEARTWNERAHKKFLALHIPDVESFYHRLLGDIALAEGDSAGATSHFLQTINFADESNHPWQRAYGMIGLATAEVQQHQFGGAAKTLLDALPIAIETGDPGGLAMVALVRAAQLFAKMGKGKAADDLARLVMDHPMSWQETRREAATILTIDEVAVPPRMETRPGVLLPLIEPIIAELSRIS